MKIILKYKNGDDLTELQASVYVPHVGDKLFFKIDKRDASAYVISRYFYFNKNDVIEDLMEVYIDAITYH